MATDDAIDPRYQLFARLRDAGFGMLAWCVVTAGLQTMPDDEYADLVAEVERIAAPPPTADLVALVREIAASDPIMYAPEDDGDNFRACRYCLVHQVWDLELPHSADCHWVRARAIVARLDAPPDRGG